MPGAEGRDRLAQVKMMDEPQAQIVHQAIGAASQGQGNSVWLLMSK